MLKEYRAKRDFKKTAEPAESGEPGEGSLTFVIQEHHATHLHWDFRLECDGVLKSWAVPKGISTDPGVKRLAVMVEDHPYAYGSFEGTIPKGQYGGGVVKIWDSGFYAPDEPTPEWKDRKAAQDLVREGIKKGKLSFTLHGKRLRGSWALVRLAKSETEWLLLKHRDEHATAGAESSAEPITQLSPMLAVEAEKPFDDAEWAFEPKLDGIRVLAYKTGLDVELISRGGLKIADRFQGIATAIRAIDAKELLLDGEIVAFDEKGRPDFEKVMKLYHAQARVGGAIFYIFDLLRQNQKDLTNQGYAERRGALQALKVSDSHLRVIESFPESGTVVFDHAVGLGFEGVMAKRLDSRYQPGQRSRDWRKIKSYHSDDFYVCGWLEGKGNRSETFGSLLLGSKREDEFVYRGNVGGGFSDDDLRKFQGELIRLAASEPTIVKMPKLPGRIHWIRPEMVIEVRYMKETNTGMLRFPTYMRRRSSVEKPLPGPDLGQSKQMEDSKFADAIINAEERVTLQSEGHRLEATNLNKELWPKSELGPAFTKRDLLLHYARVAPYILPHLKDRPMAFVRYPHGIGGEHFFQKHLAENAPSFLRTVDVFSGHNAKAVSYLIVENVLSLLWLAQMAALELHPWQSRITPEEGIGEDFRTERGLDESVLDRPDFLVLDLDPYTYSGNEAHGAEPELNRKGWEQGVEVALRLHESLDDLGYKAYLKTSGKTGLHIFVPIQREYSYDEARAMARTLGEHLMKRYPELITMEWSVKKRPAKVYFDSGQNVMGKTLAAIYSTRPTPGGLVSCPVKWEELLDIYPTDFSIATLPGLLKERGDLWADIAKHAQRLV